MPCTNPWKELPTATGILTSAARDIGQPRDAPKAPMGDYFFRYIQNLGACELDAETVQLTPKRLSLGHWGCNRLNWLAWCGQ